MSSISLAELEQQKIKVDKHEKILRECLEMLRQQKNKLQIEKLQLESMLDELIIEECKKSKPTPQFQPLPLGSTAEINDQELELGASNTLSSMLLGSYYGNDVEEEEDDDDDDDEEENDEFCSTQKRKENSKDEHSDIFDLIDF